MFRGTFEHTIDDKGRVSVPARFREVLLASNDDRVVITNFFIGSLRCLDVYAIGSMAGARGTAARKAAVRSSA